MNIDFNHISFYPNLIRDYINGKLKEQSIIDWSYNQEDIVKKASSRKFNNRKLLTERLITQNQSINLSAISSDNIAKLKQENTFTVCTGHQLSIYGGPAYFVTKIVDLIKLAQKLNEQDKQKHYVPIFWLASEDHDFDEISSIKFFNKSFTWQKKVAGPVGNVSTDSLFELNSKIKEVLGTTTKAHQLNSIFHEAYCSGKSLKEATRTLVNTLFGRHGIVIIDGDDKQLKKLLTPVIEQEIKNKISFKTLSKGNKKLDQYKIQAAPRDINLFYLEDNYRERLIVKSELVQTRDEKHQWNTEEFLNHASKFPEKISPNVLLRPVYQELCLPNVAYVGGAGEIAYWLELPPLFNALNIPFPIPIVRNSYLFLTQKQLDNITKLNLQISDFFLDEGLLVKKYLENTAGKSFDFSSEKEQLCFIYSALEQKGAMIDTNLIKVVQGELNRSLSAIENMEKRFRNAEKNKRTQESSRLQKIKSVILPGGIYQERCISFFDFDLQSDDNLFDKVFNENIPLENSIKVVVY